MLLPRLRRRVATATRSAAGGAAAGAAAGGAGTTATRPAHDYDYNYDEIPDLGPKYEYVPWARGERYSPADFSAPVYHRTAVSMIALFILYELNEHYERNLEPGQIHALTVWIASRLPDDHAVRDRRVARLRKLEKKAAENVLLLHDCVDRGSDNTARHVFRRKVSHYDMIGKWEANVPLAPEVDPYAISPTNLAELDASEPLLRRKPARDERRALVT